MAYNRQATLRMKQGKETRVVWRKPPRGNYVHWSKKTFERLQRKPPERLQSQFRLSMGQVWSLLQGAQVNKRDGLKELWDLVDSSQLSSRDRRYCRLQVEAFLRALKASGLDPEGGVVSGEDSEE